MDNSYSMNYNIICKF